MRKILVVVMIAMMIASSAMSGVEFVDAITPYVNGVYTGQDYETHEFTVTDNDNICDLTTDRVYDTPNCWAALFDISGSFPVQVYRVSGGSDLWGADVDAGEYRITASVSSYDQGYAYASAKVTH